MILFTILALIMLTIVLMTVITVGVGGAMFVVCFADVILCVLLIIFIVKCLRNKTNKKKN